MNRWSHSPLLCELHSHSSWSDGQLDLRDLIDLHGENGFDVLCVTDHVWLGYGLLDELTFAHYVEEIEAEAKRAWSKYRLLVLPGAELSDDRDEPDDAGHAVAIGLRRFVSLEDGLEHALRQARAAGAALIAAHPHSDDGSATHGGGTRRFWRERATLAPLVDRFELFNRNELFAWVARSSLPVVATGDFHRDEHLHTWKTLLPCAPKEDEVVAYLRSRGAVHLTQLAPQPVPAAA